MHEYLDRRYALALYEIGEEKGIVEDYLQSIAEIDKLIMGNKDFLDVIKHPQLSTSKKKDMFTCIFKGKVEEEVLTFLLILIEKDRILELNKILTEMKKIHLERSNTLIANVTTVVALLEEEKNELIHKLHLKYNKKIILKEAIDETIIGGVYVRVGNDVIDGTIRGKLDAIKRLTLKTE
jgi:F-type H+-transporting ATPase subunit delta